MGAFKVSDFYYGAFLSALLNYGGKKPSLFDQTDSRRIYRLTTENSPVDYYIYAKYVFPRPQKANSYTHWVFVFTPEEVQKIVSMNREGQDVRLALICVNEKLQDSEIAMLDYKTAIDCLGVNIGAREHRINIKAIDNKHGLRAYGSGRSDQFEGKDNMIRISRDIIKTL